MKNIFLILVSLFVVLFPLSAKKYGTFYFSRAQALTDNKLGFYKSVINSKSSYLYTEELSEKENSSWKVLNAENRYNFISDTVLIIDQFVDGALKSTIYRHFHKLDAVNYKFSDFANDELLLQSGNATSIMPLCKQGTVTHYYSDGKKSQLAVYDKNCLVSNQRWRTNGDKAIDNVYELDQVDIKPRFAGGDINAFVEDNISYPLDPVTKKNGATILMRFLIIEDGSLVKLEVVNKTNPLFDYEAFRVLFQTKNKWSAGEVNGKPVKVEIVVPVKFVAK